MRLVLARHGETQWNEVGRYQGWEDVPLSPRGWITARGIGVSLRRRGIVRYTLWASDLARAMSTARIAFGRFPRIDARLRELHFGEFGGHTYRENLDRYGPRFTSWIVGGGRDAPPDGETLDALVTRATAWAEDVRRAADPDETVVAVTHGGVVRVLTRALGGRVPWPEPGGVTVLRWDDDSPEPRVDEGIRGDEYT